MRTKIEWAELHAPLFLAGTNLGLKLDPTKRGGLTLDYCEEKRHLYASFGGKTARIPETSVLSMVEAPLLTKAEVAHIVAHQNNPLAQIPGLDSAQVSTPMSHVHAGPGAGQTGQEPPKAIEPAKRGPGRPKAII